MTERAVVTRIATGCALAAILTSGVFLLPSIWFDCLVLAIGIMAGWEWAKLCGLHDPLRKVGYVALFVALFFLMKKPVLLTIYIHGAAVLLWAGLAGFLIYPMVSGIRSSRCTVCSVVILTFAVFAASELRGISDTGAWWLLGALATVSIADTGAFFVGRAFGKRKLAYHVSPNKTVEGLIGGLIAVLVFATVAAAVVWPGDSAMITTFTVVCVLTGAFSVFGDLFVSKVKRSAGVKDSGRLLPGHGGVLDRVDSSLAGLPVYAFCIKHFMVPA